LKLLVEWDPKAIVRELAEILQTSHMTVWRHLRDMGMVSF
jgi:predicted ArsR family transcriptional regulator